MRAAMSARALRQADNKAAPSGGALNLNVQHIRAAIEEAAEEARKWAPNDLVCDTAAPCATAHWRRLVCARKLAAARHALQELQKQVDTLRKQLQDIAKPNTQHGDKANIIFFREAERLLKYGLSGESGYKVGEVPHPFDDL